MELALKKEFNDYYDYIFDANSKVEYIRIREKKQRATELKQLRNIGIETVKLYSVNELLGILNDNSYVVVYTDAYKHNGQGKKLVPFRIAVNNYNNCLIAPYYNVSNGFYVKYLQIGQRRFNITMYNGGHIQNGQPYDIRELNPSYHRLIGLPIFSIDYISDDKGNMVAVDFNTVENIGKLGFEKFISAEEIKVEIFNSLIAYNKIARENR